jgi:siderophore synthetase component
MDLIPYAARLHRDLRIAAESGGEETVEVAERLAASLESATRLVLLDALVEAAGEITSDLAPGSVEVRLRGREVDFAVTSGAAVEAAVAPTTTPTDVLEDTDEGGTARLSLRLPERLKPRVEQAAEAAGLSVNAWLVRSISTILDTTSLASAAPPTPGTIATGQRQTGWVR